MRVLSLICATISMIVAPVVLAKSVPLLVSSEATLAVVEQPVSTGFARGRTKPVDTIVLHSVFAEGQPDPYGVDAVIRMFAQHNVSAHYLIARNGTVYRLVAEDNTSYHAGESRMLDPDGRAGVNNFSIGIELINGYDDRFTEEQYVALETLIRDIKTRHPIRHVVAHGEIASKRRSDPWNFDWVRVRGWIQDW